MAKPLFQTAIGLDIREEYFVISQISLEEDQLIVNAVKQVTLPSSTIENGEITDPDILIEHVNNTLSEEHFNSENFIVSIQTPRFMKGIEFFDAEKPNLIHDELDEKLTTTHMFSRTDFYVGHQLFEDTHNLSEKACVTYAAMKQDIVDSIQTFMDMLEKNLVSVDLLPLAAHRFFCWDTIRHHKEDEDEDEPEESEEEKSADAESDAENSDEEAPKPAKKPKKKMVKHVEQKSVMTLFVADRYIDCNIQYGPGLVWSNTIRKNFKKIADDESEQEDLVNRIEQLLLSFSNAQSAYPLPETCIFYSTVGVTNALFERLKQRFSSIQCKQLAAPKHISFNPQFFPNKKLGDAQSIAVPAIGLALKYFERDVQTLSLTKVKKKLAPIFNRLEVAIMGGVMVGIVVLSFAINFYINHSISTMDDRLKKTKLSLRKLQAGELEGRQKKIDQITQQIRQYKQYNTGSELKTSLLLDLVNMIPDDMVFTQLNLNETQVVTIRGEAFYQDSILAFHKELKSMFSNVSIAGINSQYSNNVPVHKFEITFNWKK